MPLAEHLALALCDIIIASSDCTCSDKEKNRAAEAAGALHFAPALTQLAEDPLAGVRASGPRASNLECLTAENRKEYFLCICSDPKQRLAAEAAGTLLLWLLP